MAVQEGEIFLVYRNQILLNLHSKDLSEKGFNSPFLPSTLKRREYHCFGPFFSKTYRSKQSTIENFSMPQNLKDILQMCKTYKKT